MVLAGNPIAKISLPDLFVAEGVLRGTGNVVVVLQPRDVGHIYLACQLVAAGTDVVYKPPQRTHPLGALDGHFLYEPANALHCAGPEACGK
ncbi:hypothetical protein D3C76_1382590 [compost metagenome]